MRGSAADIALFFFLMIRRPPRSTLDRSSAASDVYKRQAEGQPGDNATTGIWEFGSPVGSYGTVGDESTIVPVSYTHLRAHETVLDLVCRLLLDKKKKQYTKQYPISKIMG